MLFGLCQQVCKFREKTFYRCAGQGGLRGGGVDDEAAQNLPKNINKDPTIYTPAHHMFIFMFQYVQQRCMCMQKTTRCVRDCVGKNAAPLATFFLVGLVSPF
jgi:hypothetical protein